MSRFYSEAGYHIRL